MGIAKKFYVCLSVFALLVAAACSVQQQPVPPGESIVQPKKERIEVSIDENYISTHDTWEIIDPVWSTADIYGSYKNYEASLAKFSRRQRLVTAMLWYEAEVNNGGHDQFYFNSTGIVWEDAKAGFEEIGIPEVAEIIGESAKRMGGHPSFDRDERMAFLEKTRPDFEDLDNKFYHLEIDIAAKVLEYIRKYPKEFVFTGHYERAS